MRKLFQTTFLIACLFTFNFISTAQEYAPFPAKNAKWNILTKGCGLNCSQEDIIYYTLGGDSLENEKIYKKLIYTNPVCDTSFIYGIIREENKKIYYKGFDVIMFHHKNEVLLYDFNAGEGDTIFHNSVFNTYTVIVKIDSTLTDNVFRKCFVVENMVGYFHPDTLVEGIGSIKNGLLGHICIPPPCFMFWENICFTQNEKLIYLNPEYTNCSNNKSTKNSNFEIAEAFNIYFEKASNAVVINQKKYHELKADIFDVSGKLCESKWISYGINHIPFRSESAIVLVVITDKNGKKIKTKKVLITN